MMYNFPSGLNLIIVAGLFIGLPVATISAAMSWAGGGPLWPVLLFGIPAALIWIILASAIRPGS